jgi:hypothetical protein
MYDCGLIESEFLDTSGRRAEVWRERMHTPSDDSEYSEEGPATSSNEGAFSEYSESPNGVSPFEHTPSLTIGGSGGGRAPDSPRNAGSTASAPLETDDALVSGTSGAGGTDLPATCKMPDTCAREGRCREWLGRDGTEVVL